MSTQDMENAKSQARAQFGSIKEMVETLQAARDDDHGSDADSAAIENAEQAIREDALSVEVRSGWRTLNSPDGAEPCEYRILLCTGGPAVQIVGQLSEHNEPETAHIQFSQSCFR